MKLTPDRYLTAFISASICIAILAVIAFLSCMMISCCNLTMNNTLTHGQAEDVVDNAPEIKSDPNIAPEVTLTKPL